MIVGAVAVVLFALLPLGVYFSFQVKQRPAVNNVLRDGLSDIAIDYFDGADGVLAKLGFERPTYLTMQAGPIVTTFIAFRVNRALGQMCVQLARRIPGEGTFRETGFVTEYEGLDEGPAFVSTGNSRREPLLTTSEGRRSVAAKRVQDLERLYRMHLAHERRGPGGGTRRVTARGYEARVLRARAERDLQEHVRRGHLREAGDDYWPTARGAFVMAMGRMPHRVIGAWWRGRALIRSLLAEADAMPVQLPTVEKVVEVTDVSSATIPVDTAG